MSFLKGYRTYICAFLIGLATVAHVLGYLDATSYNTLIGLLGAGGLAALRAAVPTAPVAPIA